MTTLVIFAVLVWFARIAIDDAATAKNVSRVLIVVGLLVWGLTCLGVNIPACLK